MNLENLDLLWLLVPILLGLSYLIYRIRPQPKLSSKNLQKALSQLKATQNLAPNHALMESHKIFVATLKIMFTDGKNQNAARLIQRVARRLPNEKAVWRLHRERNKVAHEPGYQVSQKTADEARREFERGLKGL